MNGEGDARPVQGAVLDPNELAQLATEILASSPYPAIVLTVPAGKIVAASSQAMRLLSPGGGRVLGRSLEEFTVDRPSAGGDVIAGGHLNGVETSRLLRRTSGVNQPVRMWIRKFDHQPTSRLVLAVLIPDDVSEATLTEQEWSDAPTVVGTTNASLLIERISSDAEALFGQTVPELIGRSFLGLVDANDVPPILGALSEAFTTLRGVTLDISIRSATAESPIPAERHDCEVLIVPLEPSPSCAFVFLPITTGTPRPHPESDLSGMLFRLGRGAEIARLARGTLGRIEPGTVPGLERLTTRELEIIAPLLDGDRPPAIAANLYLSQSTVRNHLTSIYAKLGVSSQQELMNAFRSASTGRTR